MTEVLYKYMYVVAAHERAEEITVPLKRRPSPYLIGNQLYGTAIK